MNSNYLYRLIQLNYMIAIKYYYGKQIAETYIKTHLLIKVNWKNQDSPT